MGLPERLRRRGRVVMSLVLCLPGATGLSACVRPPAPVLIPPAARQPCRSPDPRNVRTTQDLAGFSIEQERALTTCEADRKALIKAIGGK